MQLDNTNNTNLEGGTAFSDSQPVVGQGSVAAIPDTSSMGGASDPGDGFISNITNNFVSANNSLGNLQQQSSGIMANPDMSPGVKALAVGVVAAQTFQDVKNAVDNIKKALNMVENLTEKVDGAVVAVLGKLTFLRNIACLPIAKQMDPVFGIDMHFVNLPPAPAPVPMPHPYIGILFREKDFLAVALASVTAMAAQFLPPPAAPVTASSSAKEIADAAIAMASHAAYQMLLGQARQLGASVKIGLFIPRVKVGTPSKPIPHIPMGLGFTAMNIRKTCGYAYLGSLFVNADGDPLTGGYAHLHNDCWDTGKPPIELRLAAAAKKLFNHPEPKPADPPVTPLLELYLPTGIITPIPWNKPILVNPVPTPINPTAAIKIFIKAGFAKLGEMLIDKTKSLLAATGLDKQLGLDPKDKDTCKFWEKVSAEIGTGTSHPADVAEGHFYTRGTDFSVKGVIPLQFKRIYYSYSDYKGPLGTGWHHQYDMALAFDPESGLAGLRLADGRLTGFEIPAKGQSTYDRSEKLWLHHHKDGYYYITDKKGCVYRFTDREYKNPANKSNCHLLQSISNRNGYSLRFAYDAGGVLSQITDTSGRIFRVENDGKGRISRILAPSPVSDGKPFVIASYDYDSAGRLVKQTDAEGHSMAFEYDGSLLTKEVWRNGLAWHITYDRQGTDAKVLEVKGDGGLYHHRLEYVSPDCTVVTNSLGDRTTYFHRKGLVTKRVDPNGAETVFRYNASNELEWSQDALGNTTSASYDDLGNLTNKTSPDGGFLQIQYENEDFPHLPTSATDKAGGRWQWTYDERGNLIKRINPLQAETGFAYTDGLLTTITGPQGQETRLHYDLYHNLTDALSPDEGRNRWKYDSLGRCMRYENAKNGATEYEYNLLGDAVKVRLPDGNIRRLTYDAQGNIIQAKDNDRDVSFSYRGVNKLASRSERGATLRFRYDTEDRLRVVENEEGERYEFHLNAQGEVIEETGFDGLTREYVRDLAGRVQCVRRPDRTEVQYEYDESGRVTKVTYEDGAEETYKYRKDGLLTDAVNTDAAVTLERDVLGRVIKETCNGRTVESRYDTANNRTHIGSTLGADIEAEYNLMGDVVSLASGGWQNGYKRDVFGLETARTFGGGISSQTGRDSRGRVISHQIEKNSSILSEKSYLWGSNDRLLSVVADGKETRYEYDGWGNLSKTLFEDGKVEYRNPDRSGNLFESLDRMDRTYAKGGQLVKTKDWEYKYDRSGNLVRKKDKSGATWRYEWNAAGMLKSVKRPDAREVTFKYDALGRRFEKEFGNAITTWVWDGNVILHEQRSTYRRDWDEVNSCEFWNETKNPLVTWIFEEGTFVPAAKITENQKLSIATNYMGTPEAMYREDGAKVWTCELNSYGKVRNFQGQVKTDCQFRYQGQYEDAETGLYYNRFRYYSPDEGMYISQDPIRLRGTQLILYSFVSNPNIMVDVFGLVAGGTYRNVRDTNTGGEVHHIPANSVNGLSHDSGPSVWMETKDHQQTASHGWQGTEGKTYREQQAEYIQNNQFGKAMEMDINDIHDNFGNIYDEGIVDAINEAKNQGLIDEAEADRLKSKCNQ